MLSFRRETQLKSFLSLVKGISLVIPDARHEQSRITEGNPNPF